MTTTSTATETAERVLRHYVRGAVEIREDDLDEFLLEIERHPGDIADEIRACAEDLGHTMTADLLVALHAAADGFVSRARRIVYAVQAQVAGDRAVAEALAELHTVEPIPVSQLVMIDPRTPLSPEHLEHELAGLAVVEAETRRRK